MAPTDSGCILIANELHSGLPHIGQAITSVLDNKRLSRSWLAEKLNYDRSTIYKMLRRNTIDASLLMRISLILDYDFFNLYSIQLRQSIDSFRSAISETLATGRR